MGRTLNVIMLIILSISFCYVAGCQDTARFAVSGKAGTLGLGGEFTAGVTPTVNARVGLNTLDYDIDDEEIDDIEYDIGLNMDSVSALVDWHIFDDAFHITGGFIQMNNSVDLDARPTVNVEVGDIIYTPADVGTLYGQVDIDGLSPYIGIGWGNPLTHNQRWGFTLDLGIAFTDSPDVELSSVGGVLSSNAAFLAELEKERKDIEDDLEFLDFYPVIALGFFYRF